MAFRAALHQAGAAALSQLLQFPEPAADQRPIPCPCGSQAHYRELRSRRILSALGEVELTRPWYLCRHCHNGQFPVDRQLDVENHDCSPGVRRMDAIVGQQGPFDRGREQMKVLAGLDVTSKSVERTAEAIGADIAASEQREIRQAVQLDLPVIVGEPIPILYVQMDGTGVPVVKKETEGRQGKNDGQPAHTREVKLGLRVHTDRVGQRRFCHSRSAFHHLYRSHRNSRRIWPAHLSGSLEPGLESRANEGCHGRWRRMDLEPGRSALSRRGADRRSLPRSPAPVELARKLYPNDPAGQQAWMKVHQKRLLDKGKIEKLVLSLRSTKSTNTEVTEKIRTEADYFARNAERMRYPKFRRLHLFIGSGVIEAGCKTVIGSRLKQSGMFWTIRGANAIIALRCCHLNGRFETYWEGRRAA